MSYDGRTGNKTFGVRLPENLDLTLIELEAGRSSQATLLNRDDITVESLYLSPRLAEEVKALPHFHKRQKAEQLVLMEPKTGYAAQIPKKIS